MLRIALLDDHPAVLAGLRRLISSEPDLTVAAVASTAHELAHVLDGLRPDVLGTRLRPRAHQWALALPPHQEPPTPAGGDHLLGVRGSRLYAAARAAQADGVVDKAEPVHSLLAALRTVANGEVVMPPIPRDVFEAAVAKLDDDDLPVFRRCCSTVSRSTRSRTPCVPTRRR